MYDGSIFRATPIRKVNTIAHRLTLSTRIGGMGWAGWATPPVVVGVNHSCWGIVVDGKILVAGEITIADDWRCIGERFDAAIVVFEGGIGNRQGFTIKTDGTVVIIIFTAITNF